MALTIAFLTILFILCLLHHVNSHGLLATPRQRGALNVNQYLIKTIDPSSRPDYASHFPAGSKDGSLGAGKRSTKAAAGGNWTPYDPFDRSFRWRAGVCGDELGKPQDHVKGGKFYGGGQIVKTYKQQGVIAMEVDIVAHHNGYFEFYICDVSKCKRGDISRECFQNRGCVKLNRAPSKCDSGKEVKCGPIDKNYPGRWYLPPRRDKKEFLAGTDGTMLYQLPAGLSCKHCVVQWYWVTANDCNPPGFVDYFQGPNKPNWPKWQGQAGAIGGYAGFRRVCGGKETPEEYWTCADVKIEGNGGSHANDDDDDDESNEESKGVKPPQATKTPEPVPIPEPKRPSPTPEPKRFKPTPDPTPDPGRPRPVSSPANTLPSPSPSQNRECIPEYGECGGGSGGCCGADVRCRRFGVFEGYTFRFCVHKKYDYIFQ